MKIGVFTDSYKPYTSGVVTSISTFKTELTRLGHEIHIFAPSYPNYDETEDNVYRFFSVPAPSNPDFTIALPIHPGIGNVVKKLQLDIIHVHSPFTMGRVGSHYARKCGVPLLFTYHTRYDQYIHYLPVATELAKEAAIKYSARFCNSCDHVIVPSTEIQSIIKGHDVSKPISVIPTGVPLDKFNSPQPDWLHRTYEIPMENKVLLTVGRLTPEKNLPFLIQAYRTVKERLPKTSLVIAAQGPMEDELKNLVQSLNLSLQKDIIFAGVLPFDDLVLAYSAADLFVFSSLTETQGLVLVEAMAAGLPVAAVRASGVQEMVDHGVAGLLSDCEPDSLAEAICAIIQDSALSQQMSLAARKKAEKLSASNMALKLEQVYNELTGRFSNSVDSIAGIRVLRK